MKYNIEKLKTDAYLWNLYTRKEEYNSDFFDIYHRFPYYKSKNRNIFYPQVSDFLIKNGLKIKYPNNKKFAVCLTHDIDLVFYQNIRINDLIKSLKDLKIKRSLKILYSKTNKVRVPGLSFNKIMDLEEKFDAKSSFYFLSLEKNDLDFNFRPIDIKEDIITIIDRGWEVGLHGGHKAYNDINKILKEKQQLEIITKKKIIGYRNHYLRFKVPETWEILKKAEFKYDTTFGYADCIGFRNGMCHPFKPFTLNSNKFIDIIEIPLIIMDGTLDRYMKLDFENSWIIIKQLIDIVSNLSGVITILFHNNDLTGWKLNLYKKILKYCYEKNAWMTSGENIWKNWIENMKY